MKKLLILLSLLFAAASFAEQGCFIAKQNGQDLIKTGDCVTRYSPCSTFKVPLALMGYDAKILKNETSPKWPFKKKYYAYMETWKSDQTPASWMKNSCVWYSQVLTPKLGMQKFQQYVHKFNYGNQDLSGDVGQNNGLIRSWLSSSLEISPQEQMAFLEQLLENKLPVSQHAQNMTRNIMYFGELKDGWKLYGKTGSGYLLNADRSDKLDIKHGWFIGWIEKEDKKIVFVNHIVDSKPEDEHAGPRARAQSKEKLLELIEGL